MSARRESSIKARAHDENLIRVMLLECLPSSTSGAHSLSEIMFTSPHLAASTIGLYYPRVYFYVVHTPGILRVVRRLYGIYTVFR